VRRFRNAAIRCGLLQPHATMCSNQCIAKLSIDRQYPERPLLEVVVLPEEQCCCVKRLGAKLIPEASSKPLVHRMRRTLCFQPNLSPCFNSRV